MRDWFISLKPEYVDEILAGSKRVEFRTRIPRDLHEGDMVYVVTSQSHGNVSLRFRVKFIDTMHPLKLWLNHRWEAGIPLHSYLEYASGRNLMFALGITEVEEVFGIRVERAPQWFKEIKNDLWLGNH